MTKTSKHKFLFNNDLYSLVLLPLGFFGGLAAFSLGLVWVISVMADPAHTGLPGRLSGTELRAY